MTLDEGQLEATKDGLRPFEEAEAALVREVAGSAPWLPEAEEWVLRYALNLARVGRVRAPGGADLDLAPALLPFREHVRVALPAFAGPEGLDRGAVRSFARGFLAPALEYRDRALAAAGGRLDRAGLDRELCQKELVVVCGGGGGVVWGYLGAFALLERYGLVPGLLAGTSMGAALALFRARHARWHPGHMEPIIPRLSLGRLFRFGLPESRFGLPAAARLTLREAVGDVFRGEDGRGLTLGGLAIPLVVAATGIRNGALPRDPSYYEHLVDLAGHDDRPSVLSRLAGDVFQAVGELFAQRDRLARIHLGADPATREFDALDAVGYSSGLPGVVHYDLEPPDARMEALLEALFRREDLFRLVDGGLVDNLPARAAFGVVQDGLLGSRNAFLLGLEGFVPRLTQPLWYGLAQIAATSAAWNRPFLNLLRTFQRVLSPADIVPDPGDLRRAVNDAKAELHPDLPFLAHMIRPFPAPG